MKYRKTTLNLYNSLTNQTDKIFFTPRKTYYIYLCGPTVYHDVHIGNLRPVIVVDVIVSLLKFLDIDVVYWQNITDVNDKITDAANKINVSDKSLAKKYSLHYLEILSKINIIFPNKIVYVSDNIENIYNYTNKLIKKELTYKNNDGIYLNTRKIHNYYILSNNKAEKIIHDKKISKQNSSDFVLWKYKAQNSQYKEQPGWHTECAYFVSQLSKENNYLIDIHVGGKDLIFPHHENEIAQHCALYNNLMSKVWLHIGQVNINNEKMSKSLHNFITASDFLKRYDSNLLRYFLLSTKYTKPLNFNDDIINIAIKKISIWKNFYQSNTLDLKIDEEIIQFIEELFSYLNFSLVFAKIDNNIKKININIRNNFVDKKLIFKTMLVLKILNFNFDKNDNM